MPIFDSYDALDKEARALYWAGKYSAASLTWARGREAARTLGDHSAAFKAGFWEANAWRWEGDLHRALSLLLLLLSEEPPDAPAFERWEAHELSFEVQIALRPEIGRVRRLLADLEDLALRQAHPSGDLHYCRGELAFYQGDREQALRHYARGWQAHDGQGFASHMFAWKALMCNLHLVRRPDAESWWRHLSVTNQDKYEEARRMLKAATLILALEAGNFAAVAACVDNGCGWNWFELRGQLLLRGRSLDPLHDPIDSSHPARKLAAPERKQDVHDRYDNLLALVDYRLACLRYAAGLPAVDDLYYRQPDVLPPRITPTDPEKFRMQKRSFDFTCHLLQRHARRIDALLECDWRTHEVNTRRQRAEAIATACQLSPSPGT